MVVANKAELVAQQLLGAEITKKQWGSAMYNVLVEGLAGDGVTDDTAKLQALVNKAIAEGRKAIFFPHGTYYVTALTNADQVIFLGDNASFVGGYAGEIIQLGEGGVTQAEYTKEVSRVFNVVGYGAVGNLIADDTAAFNAAILAVKNAGGGILYIPKGKYKITQTLVIDENISLMGAGSDSTNMDNDAPLTDAISVIVWGGIAGGTVINQLGQIGGVAWKDFAVDGATIAAIGIDLDRFRSSVMSNVKVIRTTSIGLRLKPKGTVANDNCMWNVFMNIALLRMPTPLLLDGNGAAPVSGNACHNNFINLNLDYTGNGMDLYDCDNNNFSMIYTFRRGGNGYGAVFNALCRANYIYQIQGQVWAKNGSKNSIFGYDRENAQPRPTLDNGAELFWTENGSGAQGWRMTTPLEALALSVDSDGMTANGTPSTGAFKMWRPSNGQLFGVDLHDASRTTRLWTSADGAGPYLILDATNRGIKHYNMDTNNSGSVTTLCHSRAPATAGEFLQPDRTGWVIGDIIRNSAPAAGGYIGWVCITAGNPGVWKGFGSIQA